MTIPNDVCRVNLVADLGTQDIAVWGFHMRRQHTVGDTVDWARDVQDVADAVLASWVARMNTLSFGAGVKMNRVDCYHLDTAGLTLDKGTSVATGDTAWAGSGTHTLPWEVATVITLYGYDVSRFQPHAARYRGRFYLPPLAAAAVQGNSGAIGNSVYPQLVGDVGLWLQDVRDIALHDYAEISRDHMHLGVLSKVGAGMFNDLQAASIDNQFDVQKRRQNKQTPAREALDVTP